MKLKMNKIVFAGAGGHALSLLEAISDPECVAGYTAPAESDVLSASDSRGACGETAPKWLGDDKAAGELARAGYLFHIAFVYHGLPVMAARRRLIEQYREAIGRARADSYVDDSPDGGSYCGKAISGFATIIAPTAIVTPHSTICEGAAVLNGAIVNRAYIGEHSVVNSGAIVEHDCRIGSNTFIGPGVVMGGGVSVGDDCFIGLGSHIKNGVTIAPGVTVAMGANVTRDLTEPGIYHGTPLRLHRLRR